MSTGIPPKGSADWVAEQDGADTQVQGGATTTPPVKGTQAWADQAPEPEPAPKGSQEWAEQNAGGDDNAPAPAPTESKETPKTDVAPAADDPAGVSPQNNADAVMGYDQQIATLQDAAAKSKPETEEQRKKRERKEKSQKIIAAVGDGLMALSNLYFTTKGAPNMYNHQTMSQQTPLQKRLEEAKKEREANADKFLQYSLKIGDLQNDRAKTLREMQAQQEAQKLAREKAQREQEQHGWLAALQPDKQREQKGKADKAESEATTASEEAKNAPEMQKAKLETEKARGKAQKASATASYAAAGAHNRANVNEFSAWDENGREHHFRTKEAADAYAKQHGTFEETDVETKSETDSDTYGHSETKRKSKSGHAAKPKSQNKPKYSNTRGLGL